MRVWDSAGGKGGREEVESKDRRICHWGNEGLQGSAFTASSSMTNGWWVLRIRAKRLGRLLWMWPLSFFMSIYLYPACFLADFSLFRGFPLFLTTSLSGFVSSQPIISSSPSLTLCLSLYLPFLCPCSVIIPFPVSQSISSSHLLFAFHSHSHISPCIHLFVLVLSGGWVD